MVFIFYSGTGASQLLNNAPDKDIYVIHIQIFVFVSYSGTRSFTSPSFRPKHNTSVSGGNGLPKEAFLLSDNLGRCWGKRRSQNLGIAKIGGRGGKLVDLMTKSA